MRSIKSILNTMAVSLATVSASFFISNSANATPGCHDSGLISGKLITDICWECILPIRVAGIPIGGSASDVPDGASDKILCACEDNLGLPRPGITTSMWEPARLIEFQHIPGCSSVLGGHRMFPGDRIFLGHQGSMKPKGDNTNFLHYHYYAFPLLMMLDLFSGGECNAGGYMDLDLMYLSELDPTWNNDSLAFFTTPEAAMVANPIATLACIPDAISSTAGKPLNSLFWCAGSWGTIYPLSGNVARTENVVNVTSLQKVKVLAALHRRGLAWKTMGDEGLCGGELYPMFPKTQYKYTITWPFPETEDDHVTGENSLLWGSSKIVPGLETPIYTIFRWKDCCQTY